MSGRGKKPVALRKKANGYKMPAPIPPGEVIQDTLGKKKWRIGPSIGVGGFGEIYSACDHECSPKKGSNYPFVVKIEPHENGPLFVEKHFYIRNANKDDIAQFIKARKLSSFGMPTYFGNGSHEFKGEKYRYLVLERYGKDVWTLFKECGRSFPPATVFQLGLQMLDVLEYIHSRNYVHADIKGANILLGLRKGAENQAYLVDFGLATRVHDKEFKPEPKCAHNGTIEYTSRDAHLGVATMRGDLEILGYNMLQWLVGELPWERHLNKQPKVVQEMKEAFMKNVRSSMKQYPNVPEALTKFFEYINTLKPKDVPDYTKCRSLFETYLKSQGKTINSKLEFTSAKKGKSKTAVAANNDEDSEVEDKPPKKRAPKENGDIPKAKKTKKGKEANTDATTENGENVEPGDSFNPKVVKSRNTKKTTATYNTDSTAENDDSEPEEVIIKKAKVVKRKVKRKSMEPSVVVTVKKTKLAPKATPPAKQNHANISTQTSTDRLRRTPIVRPKRSPRQVSFDSPIYKVIDEKKTNKISNDSTANSSGDIFEDSFVIEEKKVKPKKRLLAEEEVIVKRVVKKKVTSTRPKAKSWKDMPTVVNGRSPPK